MSYSGEEPQIRVSKSFYARAVVGRILKGVGLVVVGAVVLYLCFSVTLLRVTIGRAGVIPVKNVTYPGGVLPAGSTVVVDRSATHDGSPVDDLRQSFVYNGNSAVVTVAAGPYGRLTWAAPGILTVDGKALGGFFPGNADGTSPIDSSNPYLSNEYVGECVRGACDPGALFLFNGDHVLGVPLSGGVSS